MAKGGRGIAAIAAIAVVLGGVLWPSQAGAHASYVRSEPAFAAELTEAPDRIDLWFSQQLFRRQGANTIRLLDPSGNEKLLREALIDSADRRHLFAAVAEPLPPGRYVVEWTNLSAEDGDDDSGRYPFYVAYRPTVADEASDRSLAEELLIPYPDDEPDINRAELIDGPEMDIVDPVTLPLVEESDDGGISMAPIALAIVSMVAVAGLIGGRLTKFGRTRRE